MNKLSIVGRFTRDPETRYSQSATPTAVTRFTVAVNRPYQKDKPQGADFFNCVTFSKRAEFIEKYGRKGRLVSVVGSMRQNNWEKDGERHTTWEVLVEEIEFLDKANDNTAAPTGAASTPTQVPDYDEDDLPF